MKSQQRHELRTNELADRLGKSLERIRPHLRQIGAAAAILVVVVGTLLMVWRYQTARRERAWTDYFQAYALRDGQALQEVALLHDGQTAALWARQAAGDVQLATGAGDLFVDRRQAEVKLREAEDNFLAVEQGAGQHPLLQRRAQYGLAQVYESLADLERAREYYLRVAEAEPQTALGRAAARRAEELGHDSLQRWYAWFERQEPPEPDPQADVLPQVPDDLDTLPMGPDLPVPGGVPSPPLGDLPDFGPPEQPGEEPQGGLELPEMIELPDVTVPEDGDQPEDGPAAPVDEEADDPQEPDDPQEAADEATGEPEARDGGEEADAADEDGAEAEDARGESLSLNPPETTSESP